MALGAGYKHIHHRKNTKQIGATFLGQVQKTFSRRMLSIVSSSGSLFLLLCSPSTKIAAGENRFPYTLELQDLNHERGNLLVQSRDSFFFPLGGELLPLRVLFWHGRFSLDVYSNASTASSPYRLTTVPSIFFLSPLLFDPGIGLPFGFLSPWCFSRLR